MEDLNNYFMKPQLMKCGLEIYPIKLLEYEEFKQLAQTYIMMDIKQINNRKKQLGEPALTVDNLFDYIIILADSTSSSANILKEIEKFKDQYNKENIKLTIEENSDYAIVIESEKIYKELLKDNHEGEICKMIEMTTKKKVEYNIKFKHFDIYSDDGELLYMIHKNNFKEYRSIVMNQNLIYEPRIAPNRVSQEQIDKEIRKQFGDGEVSLESIVAFVSTELGGNDISHYTYYRLMADFKIGMKKLGFMSAIIYRANGCKAQGDKDIEVPNLQEPLEMGKNPYANILRKAKENTLDKTLQNR